MACKKIRITVAVILIVLLTATIVSATLSVSKGPSSNSRSSSSSSSRSSDSSSSGSSRGSSSTDSPTSSSTRSIKSDSSPSRTKSSTNSDQSSIGTIEEDNMITEEERKEQEKTQKIKNIRIRLNVPETILEDETVEKLINIKTEDYRNFEKISLLTTKYIEIESNKEVFVNEISNMDKSFVERFYNKAEKSQKIEVKKQINNYINLVKNNKTVDVNIENNDIEKFFNDEIDIDVLIDKIWN